MSQLRPQSISCNPNLGHNHCIVRNRSWGRQLRDQTLCFSAWDWFFSVTATKGWAWCNHNAELVERTVALGNLKLLVGSGDLDFTKGMDSLDKHVEQISFGQWVTFFEHGSWKAGSPTWNPLRLKSQSRQVFVGFQQSHTTIVTILDTTTAWPNPLLLMTHVFFLQMQRRDGHDATIMQSWWSVLYRGSREPQASGKEGMFGIPKRNGGNGFLRQTCRTNLLSAVRHIFRTWAAERLAAPLRTHCG